MALWQPEERVAVLDGDLIIHAAANKFNDDDTNERALEYIDSELKFHCGNLELHDCIVYTTAGGNFRKDIAASYKAHRADKERPKYLVDCYKFLFNEWNSQAIRGYEADDLLAIAITEHPDWLLVSYDKDLKQVPGWHYDWRSYDLFYVTEAEADYFLARQMLEGDRADNIKGVHGIGPKKAEKLLGEVGPGLQELLTRVFEIYRDNGLSSQQFVENYKLLKILRTKELSWPEIEQFKDNNNE